MSQMSAALQLALYLALAAPAAPAWTRLADGIQYQTFANGTGQAFRLDLRRVRLRVAPASPSAHAADLARKTGAVIAVNGGYFTPEFKPLGLLVSRGKSLNSLRKADWGVLAISTSGKARLAHTRDYRPRRDTDFAIQAGPRLVVRNRALNLKPQRARRTALGIQRDGRTLIVVVADSYLLLDDLARLMRDRFECPNALNLDGGSSTQLWSSLKGVSEIRGAKVANAVLVLGKD